MTMFSNANSSFNHNIPLNPYTYKDKLYRKKIQQLASSCWGYILTSNIISGVAWCKSWADITFLGPSTLNNKLTTNNIHQINILVANYINRTWMTLRNVMWTFWCFWPTAPHVPWLCVRVRSGASRHTSPCRPHPASLPSRLPKILLVCVCVSRI